VCAFAAQGRGRHLGYRPGGNARPWRRRRTSEDKAWHPNYAHAPGSLPGTVGANSTATPGLPTGLLPRKRRRRPIHLDDGCQDRGPKPSNNSELAQSEQSWGQQQSRIWCSRASNGSNLGSTHVPGQNNLSSIEAGWFNKPIVTELECYRNAGRGLLNCEAGGSAGRRREFPQFKPGRWNGRVRAIARRRLSLPARRMPPIQRADLPCWTFAQARVARP
jgi:hypothetical protein